MSFGVQPTAKPGIDVGALKGKKFSEVFYHVHDLRRGDTAAMYAPDAVKVWNGHVMTGKDAIASFLANFPVSQHEVESVDAHQVYLGGNTGTLVTVTVTGFVKFGFRPKFRFKQTFSLERDPSQQQAQIYTILSDTFRSSSE